MGASAGAGERSGVRYLGDAMNSWAGDGQMARDLGGGPKIALFSTFGRVITLIMHMFWEWARGGFNRIRITISALKNPTNPNKTRLVILGSFLYALRSFFKKNKNLLTVNTSWFSYPSILRGNFCQAVVQV